MNYSQDFKVFCSLMQALRQYYGKQYFNEKQLVFYYHFFEQYALEEIRRGIGRLFFTRKYTTFPTVAEIIENIEGGSIEDRAEIETGKAVSAIAELGAYATVVFDNPVTQAVIFKHYGGWPAFCHECGNETKISIFRKDFAKIWIAYARQGEKYFGKLSGITEIHNSANGFLEHIEHPKFIGNQDEAKKILEAGIMKNITSNCSDICDNDMAEKLHSICQNIGSVNF